MNDYRPYTDGERRLILKHAKKIEARPIPTTLIDLDSQLQAVGQLRYEATLQAKDVQIAALVAACRKFSGLHGYAPAEEADAAWVDPQDWAEFDEAWKEATNE